MPVIRVENLTKTYGQAPNELIALKNVNLTFEQGEFVAIMGPSGSGKSTLLHMIGGLDKPTSGVVSLDETLLSDMNDKALSRLRRQKIGFVFQFFNLLPALTARENVALPLILDGVPRSTALTRADKMLADVGLADRKTHRPAELSGGQQQRVSIARALAIEPMLILGDEPTGALDTQSGNDVLTILREIVTTGQRTVILATHESRVTDYADRLIRIKDGAIIDDTRLTAKPNSDIIQPKVATIATN
ncbi:MAG: ABC transporter ATP-binding protein [Chloroflexota bacterium]